MEQVNYGWFKARFFELLNATTELRNELLIEIKSNQIFIFLQNKEKLDFLKNQCNLFEAIEKITKEIGNQYAVIFQCKK